MTWGCDEGERVGKGIFFFFSNGCSKEWNLESGNREKKQRDWKRIIVVIINIAMWKYNSHLDNDKSFYTTCTFFFFLILARLSIFPKCLRWTSSNGLVYHSLPHIYACTITKGQEWSWFFFLLRYIADFRPSLRGDNTLGYRFWLVTRLPRDRHWRFSFFSQHNAIYFRYYN